MAITINKTINSLNGGISKQEDNLRFDGQVKDMVNMIPDERGIIYKRNGFDYLSVINDSNRSGEVDEKSAVHSYERGINNESYLITMTPDVSVAQIKSDGTLDYKTIVNLEDIRKYFVGYEFGAFNSSNYQTSEFDNAYFVLVNFEDKTDRLYYKVNDQYEVDSMFEALKLEGHRYGIARAFGSDPEPDLEDIEVISVEDVLYWGFITIPACNYGVLSIYNVVDYLPISASYNDYADVDWSKRLKFVTVGDTTWVLDTEKTVDSFISYNDVNTDRAFYWIKKSIEIRYGTNGDSSKGYDYSIVLDGRNYTVNSTSTDGAVKSLETAVNSSLDDRFFVRSSSSVLSIVKSRYTSLPQTISSVNYKDIRTVDPDTVDETKANLIYIADDSNGTNAKYYNMQVGSDISSALIKTTTEGGYIRCNNNSEWKQIWGLNSLDSGSTIVVNNITYEPENTYYGYVSYFKDENYGYKEDRPVAIQEFDENDTSFEFLWGDSFGNQASQGWRDSVDKIEDLPVSMQGFSPTEVGTIAITGTDNDSFNNYYVRLNDDGYWEETYRPNTSLNIIPNFIAKICMQQSGSFAVGMIRDYTKRYDGVQLFDDNFIPRLKGDDVSNPTPSFVGSKVSNIFFYGNRLGFTSGESVCLSVNGDYYNFFATTMLEVLDTDPVDISLDSNMVSNIQNISLSNGDLYLFADNTQFRFYSPDGFVKPLTARIQQLTSYSSDTSIEPIAVDNSIIFFDSTNSYIRVNEMNANTMNDKTTANDLSLHIKGLISKYENTRTAFSKKHNILFISTSENDIMCYKYSIVGDKKVLGAWFRFKIGVSSVGYSEVKILSLFSIDDYLYIYSSNNQVFRINIAKEFESQNNELFTNENDNGYVVLSKFAISDQNGTSKYINEDMTLRKLKVNIKGSSNIYIEGENNDNKKIGYIDENRNKISLNFKNTNNIILQANGNFSPLTIGSISFEGSIMNRTKNTK